MHPKETALIAERVFNYQLLLSLLDPINCHADRTAWKLIGDELQDLLPWFSPSDLGEIMNGCAIH